MTLNIIAFIKNKKSIYSYGYHELIRNSDGNLIWAYMYYDVRKENITNCIELTLDNNRKIKDSWNFRFEPEDLKDNSNGNY